MASGSDRHDTDCARVFACVWFAAGVPWADAALEHQQAAAHSSVRHIPMQRELFMVVRCAWKGNLCNARGVPSEACPADADSASGRAKCASGVHLSNGGQVPIPVRSRPHAEEAHAAEPAAGLNHFSVARINPDVTAVVENQQVARL